MKKTNITIKGRLLPTSTIEDDGYLSIAIDGDQIAAAEAAEKSKTRVVVETSNSGDHAGLIDEVHRVPGNPQATIYLREAAAGKRVSRSPARIIWSWTASVVTGRIEHSVEAAGYEAKVAIWPNPDAEGGWSIAASLAEAGEDGKRRNYFAAACDGPDAAKAAAKYHKVRLAKILRRELKAQDAARVA